MDTLKAHIYLPKKSECSLVTPDESIIDRFIKYNIEAGRATLSTTPEEADFILIFQEWSFKQLSYIQQLRSEPLIINHSEKLYVVNYDSTVGEGFLSGSYVSLRLNSALSNRYMPCAYPKTYNNFSSQYSTLKTDTKHLYSFRGTLHSHPVRKAIYNETKFNPDTKIIDNTKAFHTHSDDEKKIYLEEILDSIFVLCPRGTSPNSYRLFEVMSMGRCPVIIADDWIETSGPDWSKCSIRIAENQIASIDTLLRSKREEGIAMGENARLAWEKYFSEQQVYKTYLDQSCALHNSEHVLKMNFDQLQQHWRSSSFLKNNEWSLAQRIARKLTSFKNNLRLS